MAQRFQHIDIAKGLGIFLVVLGHSWFVVHEKGELFQIIFSFHMPLFFFLSGIFFSSNKSLFTLLRQKADAVLKPYFSTLLVFGLLLLLSANPGLPSYIQKMLYGSGGTVEWSPLWFLTHLYVVYLFAWLFVEGVSRLPSGWKSQYFLLAGLLLVGTAHFDYFWQYPVNVSQPIRALMGQTLILPGLPFSLDVLPVSSFYFLMGFYLRSEVKAFKGSNLGTLGTALIFVALHIGFDHTIDLNFRLYDHLLVSTIQAMLGIYLTLSSAITVQKVPYLRDVLAYLGSSSLFLLIFHYVIQNRTFVFLENVGVSSPPFNASIAFLAGMIGPLLIQSIVHQSRYLSWLYLPLKLQSRPTALSKSR